jgi:hypothetical protein
MCVATDWLCYSGALRKNVDAAAVMATALSHAGAGVSEFLELSYMETSMWESLVAKCFV